MRDLYISKDANGNYCVMRKDEHVLDKGITVLGMDIKAIARLRGEYIARGGTLPITEESIRNLFKSIP